MSLDPSLALIPSAFKAGKLYSVLPEDGSGDFTVSRNGTATYFDRDGLLKTTQANEPRFEFDPLTGEFKGVLVEPSATNLLLRSEEFENHFWSKFNLNTTGTPPWVNVIEAPNGTLAAEKLIPDTTNTNLHRLWRGITNVMEVGQTYSASIFAKKGELEFCIFRIVIGSNIVNIARVDLNNGNILADSGNGTTRVKNIGNGWYRIITEFTATYASSEAFFDVRAIPTNQNDNVSWQGDGVSGIYIWGAQLETGSVATSYIPTQDSQVTRPADIITRTNVADLIGQEEGSVYIKFYFKGDEQSKRIIELSLNSISNRLQIASNNNFFNAAIVTNGVIQGSVISTNAIIGLNKIIATYTQNQLKLFLNGNLIGQTSINNLPELQQIFIGSGVSTSANNMYIKSTYIFKRALTDAEAISLTTL